MPGRFGTPPDMLAAAKDALPQNGMRIVKSSRVWKSAPVPASDQPWFYNAVVVVETHLSPFGILESLQKIENDLGRTRSVRNAAREIDLDLIAYHEEIIDKPELIVPHPRLQDRAFVLLPLQDIAPDWVHPISGSTLSDMVAILPSEQEIVAA